MFAIRSVFLLAITAAFILSLSAPAQADGVTAFFLIDRVESGVGGDDFHIVPEGPVENPDGCPQATRYQSWPVPHPGSDERLSLALMALTAGREVRVTLSGCSGSPDMTSITVR